MSATKSAFDSKIKKLLIANRGEIARRIQKASSALQIPSVLVVSDPDRESLAARESAECAFIGGSSARESYLDIDKIITAAKESGCDAIHPGYGFLSENGDFASRVRDEGLIFVGPSPESIRALGSKPSARKAVTAVGVPVTPGSDGVKDDQELAVAADQIGFPIIIKAAAGGGGRGMRIVRAQSELGDSLLRARAEALKNFGSAEVYFEKFIEQPKHVEVQLFGDKHGNVIHFGTRDCSAQRRHQKLVEEAPAPFLSEATREKIHSAAVRAAESVGYYNAGTAEFLVKGDEFYFLEINTRIQVEHPVTEAITGVDLVQLQLKIAMGEKLPYTQDQVTFSGHAIEFRINAEDVAENFRPATGSLGSWRRNASEFVREDFGYTEGDTIPPYYDSLLSKVIVSGSTRAEALSRAYLFFRNYSVSQMPTTIPFHRWLLCTEQFQKEGVDIGFVEREFKASALEVIANLSTIDPSHRSVEGSAAFHTERVSLPITESELLAVDVIHEPGGTFLAVPLTANGCPEDQSLWCRSNVRAVAIEKAARALHKDLL